MPAQREGSRRRLASGWKSVVCWAMPWQIPAQPMLTAGKLIMRAARILITSILYCDNLAAQTESRLISAGETPEILEAWPIVPGLTAANFCLASVLSPVIES